MVEEFIGNNLAVFGFRYEKVFVAAEPTARG